MRAASIAVLLVLGGCGRLGYDSLPLPAAPDAAPDVARPADAGSAQAYDAGWLVDAAGPDIGPTEDASAPLDGSPTDGDVTDAEPDATAEDAGPPSCVSGAVLSPILVTDRSAIGNESCNSDRAQAQDDLVAGLDRFTNTLREIDGHNTTSCIQADFGALLDFEAITVRARTSRNACGEPCTACSEGASFWVFQSTDGAAWNTIQWVDLRHAGGAALGDYSFATSGRLRYVLMCRQAYRRGALDIEIDSAVGHCPP